MPTVVIDCHPESALRYKEGFAIVAVDVIRATTTIATAVSLGRRCYPVSSRERAHRLAAQLTNPLLAGEVGGIVPQGFEMNNSPADLVRRVDSSRPLILLSSSGTKLIDWARHGDAVYVACLRNFAAVAREVAKHHARVAVIGAGSRGQFREEDQMCCAWIAGHLLDNGYSAANAETLAVVRLWPVGRLDGIMNGASADYLIRSGQSRDLEFVISHVADLDQSYILEDDEVVETKGGEQYLASVPAGMPPSRIREPIL